MLPSPDGTLLALVSHDEIRLMDRDGSNLRTIFTYAPKDAQDLSSPAGRARWAADNRSIRFVVPATNPFNRPAELTTIWDIPTDGAAPSIVAHVPGQYMVFLSPDASQLAYARPPEPDMAFSSGETHLMNLATGEDRLYFKGRGSFVDWGLDSKHFVFWLDEEPNYYLGNIESAFLAPLTHSSLYWVDNEYFLYQDNGLRLGTVGQPGILIDEQAMGFRFVR
ncbi:MAG TPA: hypothetical protein PKE45_01115 [Caldilineaceae bacterium]|nr:hypothetical protein [Caldilineaceae bacterium]